MDKIKIMVNGLPGNMAAKIARQVSKDNRMELIRHSLTGPEIEEKEYPLDGAAIVLIRPEDRQEAIIAIKKDNGRFISVDFTHPTAVNDNAQFYCSNGLAFVMGTTGGNRDPLQNMVEKSDISAVIAPNMAKQIVGLQAMMEYAAETFPGLFGDFTMSVEESHQQGKADTSGTAKAMVGYFNRLGVDYSENKIRKERDPAVQRQKWGIPEPYLQGHGWHTYTLDSRDRTVRIAFTHNINGRDVYVQGTLDAVVYLNGKILQGKKGKAFSMIDVLKGN